MYLGKRVTLTAAMSSSVSQVHPFRHTFSTMHLEQGGPIDRLSRELGHSKGNVTEQYIKSLPPSVARQDHEEYSPVRRLKLSAKRIPAS